jgi:hypothetical protein
MHIRDKQPSFLVALTRSWVGLMSGIAGIALGGVALYLNQVWQKVVWGFVSILCIIVACYQAWNEERQENDRLRARVAELEAFRSELLIYPGNLQEFYLAYDHGTDRPPTGIFLRLEVTIENRGPRNSNVRDFDLTVLDTKTRFEGMRTQVRDFVQTRTANHGIGRESLGNEFTISGHTQVHGILPFWIADQKTAEGVGDARREIEVEFTVRDTMGVSASKTFKATKRG